MKCYANIDIIIDQISEVFSNPTPHGNKSINDILESFNIRKLNGGIKQFATYKQIKISLKELIEDGRRDDLHYLLQKLLLNYPHLADDRKIKFNKAIQNLGFKVENAEVVPFTKEEISPELRDELYTKIINILHKAGEKMEDTSKSHRDSDEEMLRNIFLAALNTHDDLTPTGETFNRNGKTDISIFYQGKNIFVAECKIWHGEKSITEGIDQLLSYLTWRNNKTALLVFNHNQNFSDVVRKIKETAESHKCYEELIQTNNNSFQYKFHYPDDNKAKLIVTFISFNFA